MRILMLVALGAMSADAGAQQRRTLTWSDFAAMRGVSDPQVAPDGRRVLYTVRVTDVAANRRVPTTWVMPIDGGSARPFPNDSMHVTEPRWSPDGSRVAYIAAGQLWISGADGADPRQLTRLSGGASGPVWSPSGDRIAFVSPVYPDCGDDACNAARNKAKDSSKVKAHVADQLMFRHWNGWDDGTRSHLFVIAPAGGDPVDLTGGARYDVPPGPFGGSEGYAFSPDGRELAYTAKDAGRDDATSTDVNLYTVQAQGGPSTVITASNRGADQNPVYSPDGRFIAYASQQTAGFESDHWRLMLYDRAVKSSRELLAAWDRNAESYFFAPDTRMLYVGTGDRGRDKLFRIGLDPRGIAIGRPVVMVEYSNNTAFTLSRDGRTLVWLRDAIDRPAELYARVELPGSKPNERQLTHENDALIAQLSMHAAEDFWFAGAKGDSVHGFIVKPPNWQAGRSYPVVLLIHGGPQGAWLDNWSARWNVQLFAAIGAAVIAINPRGSTGYGQAFTNGVTRDWGGKVYEDLMKGVDAALARNPWMDSTRMAAAGGSFGGYMVNWIAGHTNRFKALVSHAGIFNLESMSTGTEELWFTDWEFAGPFWNPRSMDEQYRKWSPHLAAAQMKTPTLIVAGELDYRVPYFEGLSMFTTLQRQGVPSRFIVYPDEGHWILKPQNSRLWYAEVQAWIQKFTGARTAS